MQHTVYLFDGFQLDVTRRKLISSGGLVQPLNSRAMDALLLLVTNAGELVQKRRLMQTIWPNVIVEDNNLNQCILAIRKALGEAAGSNRYIMTEPGRGYRFVTPVHTVMRESLGDTAVTPVLRQRQLRIAWLSLAAMVCVLPLAILLLRGARERADPVMVGVDGTDGTGLSVPNMVLRLREAPAADGALATVSFSTLLAQCLATRPDMKLRVQVELVPEGASPIWTGHFVAGAHDLLAVEARGDPAARGCAELIDAAR